MTICLSMVICMVGAKDFRYPGAKRGAPRWGCQERWAKIDTDAMMDALAVVMVMVMVMVVVRGVVMAMVMVMVVLLKHANLKH